MGLKCGIIGLPNVGKSTLFNALTKSAIKTANFPFCTINPNLGVALVLDQRLNQLADIIKPQRIVFTTMEFVDIAGLVQGAAHGKGLGNRCLMSIRETEIVGHVVRCFKGNNIIHVTGSINPEEDINIINIELALSDLNACEQAFKHIHKRIKSGDKNLQDELLVLKKCLLQLEDAKMLRSLDLDKKEKKLIQHLNFISLKPTMYIANISENNYEGNCYLDKVYEIADRDGSIVVPICAIMEAKIAKLSDKERNEFMVESNIKNLNLNHVVNACYTLLNLQTFFTVGMKEVRAWTIPIGATALQAAGKIHTDIKKGFIRVQIIAFKDFITYKGERGAKEAGRMRIEGKNYIIKDGDILNFLFNI